MKNKAILLSLLLTLTSQLFAQDSKFKLGIRFAPSVAFNKVEDIKDKYNDAQGQSNNDTISYESNSAGVRFSAGLFGDFYFSKNYAFHTGLWYTVSRTAVKFSQTDKAGNPTNNGKAVYNLQTVQIPIALKLFTNEISTDMKLYFTLGGIVGIRINEKRKEWEVANSRDISTPSIGDATGWGDFGVLLGIGAEYQMAESTILYAGITYNRGLVDVLANDGLFKNNGKAKDNYTVINQLLGLEVGIKF